MSYTIPESKIEETLNSVDIVDTISEYVSLKKSGSNYKALCPFHRERTPSFTVNPKKQMFYCFGCQTGGNVITFLMKHENMSFPESVRLLAEKAGVDLPAAGGRSGARALSLLNVNRIAADFFHRYLVDDKSAEKAREYLKSRDFGENIIDKFHVGYAPAGNGLVEEMRAKGLDGEIFNESGLFTSDRKRMLFRRRIMLPIFNTRGKVIGFGGRTVGNGQPKYINSPETAVYHKSHNLYGMNLAREQIRQQGNAIVVEGYFDMMRAWQHGFKNVVASLGTALSDSSVKDQVYMLRRYTKEVIVVYDADTAGVAASLRNLDLFLENEFVVRIAELPSGEDPDSLMAKSGSDAFAKAIGESKNLLDYKLGVLASCHNRLTVEGRVKIVNEMLPTISKVNNAVERAEYVKNLAQYLSIDEEAVSVELNKLRSKSRSSDTQVMETYRLAPLVTERTLLQLMLEDEKVLKQVQKELKPEEFSHPDYRRIVETIFKLGSSDPKKITSRIQKEKFNRIIAQLLVKTVPYIEKEKAVKDCIGKIRKQRIKRRRAEIQKEIEQKESQGDIEAVRKLLLQYQELIKVSKKNSREA